MRGQTFILLLALLAVASCGSVQAGGDVSGVPDTTVGDWRFPIGTQSTGGGISLFREQNWTQAPSGRVSAR